MSSSFHVLPTTTYIPSYKEVIDLGNKYARLFISDINITKNIRLDVNLQVTKTHELVCFNKTAKIVQNELEYAWFYVLNIGGTECYYYKNIPIDREAWAEEIKSNLNAQKYRIEIGRYLDIGYRWIFRRGAGQHAIISLAHGMLAASLATLTNGLIYSDDGAWDYSKFPSTADEFMSWYFITGNTGDCSRPLKK